MSCICLSAIESGAHPSSPKPKLARSLSEQIRTRFLRGNAAAATLSKHYLAIFRSILLPSRRGWFSYKTQLQIFLNAKIRWDFARDWKIWATFAFFFFLQVDVVPRHENPVSSCISFCVIASGDATWRAGLRECGMFDVSFRTSTGTAGNFEVRLVAVTAGPPPVYK